MPRIVFWSPYENMTGNTHTAVAISTLMGMTHKVTSLLMQANFNSRKMESSFTPYEELKQSGVFNNSNIGINALIRLISSNKLTADSIQNYAKPVLKERLDVLYGMSADDPDGYKQIIDNLPYMTRKADEIYDLVFVDMPKSLDKKSIMDTVADAEIVVCVVNQDAVKFSDFFTTLSNNESLKDKTKIIVIADYEAASKFNVMNIKLKYLIVTNLYRDYMQRNANPDYVYNKLQKGLNKDITLILNSDDPFSSMLGEKNKNKCVYFGIDKLDTDKKVSNNLINDFLVCPKCSSNLKYDYIRYHQIGQVHCPNCSFESKKADFLGNLDYKNNIINVTNKNNNYKFKMINDSIFNCYNEMALITTLFTLNIDEYKIKSIIEKLELPKIRYMSNYANGVEVINFVSKGLNAVATSRVLDYLTSLNDNIEIVLLLDDQFDNKNNSETMTWIYDIDFELLNKPNVKKIIVGGVRNRDYKLRLLLAGIDKEKIFTCDKEEDIVDLVTTDSIDKIFILFDVNFVSKGAKINERVVEKIKKENL